MRALGGQGKDLVIPRLDLSLRESVLGGLRGTKVLLGAPPKAFPSRWEMSSWLLGRYTAHSDGGRGEKKE